MILTAAADAQRQGQAGLRPMDPGRDLRSIADLIESAFAEDLDARGRAVLRDMRWMARLSPFVWWWAQADPSFQESLHGFVWEVPQGDRRSQVVGNVSLNRAPGNRQWWIICNVAVRDDYRGQGIARRLTAAAIDEARELGARGVVLQVYQENRAALRLYTDLGFEEVAGETDLRLEALPVVADGSRRPVLQRDAPGYRLELLQPRQGRAAYELACQVTTGPISWLAPVRPDEYGVSLWARAARALRNLAGGRQTYRLGAWQDGQLAAAMTVTAAFQKGAHRLELVVRPDARGRVEGALLSRALYMLEEVPRRTVWVTVNKEHTAALEVLRSLDFQERRTLLTMSKEL